MISRLRCGSLFDRADAAGEHPEDIGPKNGSSQLRSLATQEAGLISMKGHALSACAI